MDFRKVKQIKNRMKKTDWLFLNASVGVVEGDLGAIETYSSSGGNTACQLTVDEINLLNGPSTCDVGYTLGTLGYTISEAGYASNIVYRGVSTSSKVYSSNGMS